MYKQMTKKPCSFPPKNWIYFLSNKEKLFGLISNLSIPLLKLYSQIFPNIIPEKLNWKASRWILLIALFFSLIWGFSVKLPQRKIWEFCADNFWVWSSLPPHMAIRMEGSNEVANSELDVFPISSLLPIFFFFGWAKITRIGTSIYASHFHEPKHFGYCLVCFPHLIFRMQGGQCRSKRRSTQPFQPNHT